MGYIYMLEIFDLEALREAYGGKDQKAQGASFVGSTRKNVSFRG